MSFFESIIGMQTTIVLGLQQTSEVGEARAPRSKGVRIESSASRILFFRRRCVEKGGH